MHKFHTVFKTTNLLNGKYYIGKHSTNHPLDNYRGSGDAILAALDKHGRENFEKEILFNFETSEEAFAAEKECITQGDIDRRDCYNLKPGGRGGCNTGWNHTEEAKKKSGERHHGKSLSQAHRDAIADGLRGKKHSEAWRKAIGDGHRGKPKSEDHRKALSDAKQGASLSVAHCEAISKGKFEQYNGLSGEIERKKLRDGHTKRFNGPEGDINRHTVSEGQLKSWNGLGGEERRRRVSIALGMTDEKIAARRIDIEQSDKSYGWKAKLARKWNISEVGPFIHKYATDLVS